MSSTYANISPERPLVIRSYDEMLDAIKCVLSDAGLVRPEPEAAPMLPERDEMNTHQVREYLTKIGYKVGSYQGLMAVVDKLPVTKRGKLNWWKTEDIKKINPLI